MKRYLYMILAPVVSVIMAFLLLTVSSCDNSSSNSSNNDDPDPSEVGTAQNGIFGYSKDNYFFIQNVTENGMAEEISHGRWKNIWDSMTSFTMADGRQYIFGHRENWDWFIQEILPTGDLVGSEASFGTFEHYFPILSAFTIPDGKTFIYGQLQATDNGENSSYWFTMAIDSGGKLNTKIIDEGYWENWYPNALVTNPNSESPVLFCEDSEGNWILRPISEDGKIPAGSKHGQLAQYYDTIQTYTVGGDVYLFGQNADTKSWSILRVSSDMTSTDSGVWNDYYDTVAPFSIDDRTFLFLQSGTYWNIMEVLSDGKMGNQIGSDGHWDHHYEFVFPVSIDQAYLEPSCWMTNIYDLIKDRTLQEIAIPGSHDAGMAGYEEDNDHPGCLTYGNNCDTQTQTNTIYDQLNAGARYFDIRPTYLKYWQNETWWTGHYDDAEDVGWVGCAGEKLEDVLDDVVTFCSEMLTSGGKELIILDFSHCYAISTDSNGDWTGSGCSDDEWVNDVRNAAVEKLGSFLVNWSQYANPLQAKFGDRDPGQYVLLIFDTGAIQNDPASGIYNSGSNGFRIYNEYADSNSFSEMSTDQQQKLTDPDNHSDQLFLLSWTLTLSSDQAYDCEWGRHPTSILDLAAEADSQLMSSIYGWIPDPITQTLFPNIIYVDNFAPFATRTAIYLNENYSTLQP